MPPPEEPGEAADPHYSRWMNGLGLTETRILPHYQFIREHILDGQKVEDIALADSRKRHFLALPDGSYLMCSDGHEALYGKAWYFADGTLEEINEDEDVSAADVSKTKRARGGVLFLFRMLWRTPHSADRRTKGAMALASPWRTME